MEPLLLGARLMLATVFALASIAKLGDLEGSRRALVDFGIPGRIAMPLGLVLPIVELVIALSLLFAATVWWGAVGALALLLIFIAGIGANLARGRRPSCRCFGQLHAAPVGSWTVARNAVLASVAGLIVWLGRADSGPSLVGWLADLTAMQAAGVAGGAIVFAGLALQGWLLLHLLRQNGRLLVRVEALEAERVGEVYAPAPDGAASASQQGLPVGAPAPNFRLASVDGQTVSLDALRAHDRPALLLLMDPGCGPCEALLPDVARWQDEYADRLSVAVVSRGDAAANRQKVEEHSLRTVLLQQSDEVADAYEAHGTPSAVLVRSDGTIGSPVAPGAEAIRALVARAAQGQPWIGLAPVPMLNGHAIGHDHHHEPASRPTPRAGDPAPTFTLPDLDGSSVNLADFRGARTLLLFWNPDCGFCQQLLPDLRAWEADPPAQAPGLLVVSTGSPDSNGELGLRSPVLLDHSFDVAPMFGAHGTPMAVLVDADGTIASEVVAGGQAVLALAGVHHHDREVVGATR